SASSSSVASSDTTSSASSDSSSSVGNQAPEVNLTRSDYGMTIHVNARGATDAEGDELTYLIDFGDDTNFQYPEAWHTYMEPGTYTVTVSVSDGVNVSTVRDTIEVGPVEGNQA